MQVVLFIFVLLFLWRLALLFLILLVILFSILMCVSKGKERLDLTRIFELDKYEGEMMFKTLGPAAPALLVFSIGLVGLVVLGIFLSLA